MPATISVSGDLADKVAEFIQTEALSCEIVTDPGATIQIVPTTDRDQSDATTLQAGGWIACEDAFAMATRLGVPANTIGKLLNHLDVRIRTCQLGCF